MANPAALSAWSAGAFSRADGGRLPAPAKLNLSLRVVGRRGDGMHLIDSIMTLIDLCDWVEIRPRRDSKIARRGRSSIGTKEDLALAAARLLQSAAGVKRGAEIAVTKNIPVGGGLGGGSSDAAAVLLALNRLWGLGWPRIRLQKIALSLGADVPFFIFGRTARARGVGEKLTAKPVAPAHYLIVAPRVRAETARAYRGFDLTNAPPPRTIADSQERNDLTTSICAAYPRIGAAMADLRRAIKIADATKIAGATGAVRLSGSGACIFAPFASVRDLHAAARRLRRRWFCAAGIAEHPLWDFAN